MQKNSAASCKRPLEVFVDPSPVWLAPQASSSGHCCQAELVVNQQMGPGIISR
jgi:hypothetical protein